MFAALFHYSDPLVPFPSKSVGLHGTMDSKSPNNAVSTRHPAGLDGHSNPGSKAEKEIHARAPGDKPENGNLTDPQLVTTSKLILLAACLTFSNIVSSLLSGSVTVILDDLAADLHIEENNLQWAFNSAQLPFVSQTTV